MGVDNFNRIVSFVLGLIVVVVFLAAVTGRLNLRNRLKNLGSQTKTSPTPVVKVTSFPTPKQLTNLSQEKTNSNSPTAKTPTTIPATGLPSFLLPLVFSTFSLGIYLRKKAERN
ncbi:hypothetical protein A3C98_00760 [Candidatus Roizmanbacteria bacterium RIFCSPHIGHO2_02_FULL_37_15]|uniref:Uncharacterized protein n=1 Tax=Candidatus Roizmanbacteria bacterium RIFCSPLOWO2_01_FULL_37_16 TaxID=1802058 RepID=A0A1F7INV7_9BACT|nr:MAG: hypothetical protein A2859_03750 [Candidatus Roizmanbacteria bacterium RIFCSPHIGHO2_01_FULL_37_16b]OGK21355.1 MAG: hypothetical protein A3C98_00760 [Candidatus Roizmanbacteria bacterium RIFCSPHIGHO2_02_FULL_37_15]OGK32286.1 MAG: hypothetical protein A3F57_03880 [Candidatus Roizmanbacteria bacterium RIFCSPHIGHO2_12_FULL_36_11]OGK45045.1 MAG: hypothetical protein A3B40_01365 [Candidatus Roizmanbacteria bacterium RIFCSPLOWO2_01_FULL_37_16]